MNIKSFLQCLSVGVLTLCFGSISAQSQNTYCVGPSATGDGSGGDWNNIKAWSGTPARGDTWYLEGGTYSGKIFNVAVSGASLITITKATTLNHVTDTGWNNSIMSTQAVFNTVSGPDGTYAAMFFTTSYWVVDGVNPQNTNWDMNPSDYGFKVVDGACWGIDLCGTTVTTNFTIAHFAAKGVSGTSDPGTACAGSGKLDDFVECYYGHGYEVDGVTVSSCLLNGWEASVCFPVGSVALNWLIQGNVIMNNKYYSDAHCEDINENAANCKNITIRNNLFYNANGVTGCIVPALNGNSDGPWYIYGNVFYKNLGDGGGGAGANGIIGTGSSGVYAHNVYIFNNTFDGNNDIWLNNLDASSGSVLTGAAANNLFYNQTGGTAGGPPSGFGTVDYSAYYSCSGGNNGDAHPQTATGNPFVNDAAFNFELVSNTIAGTNLGAPFNVDPNGDIRTTWSRGAFEYGLPNTQEPVISNIQCTPGTNTATITWMTDEAANSIVNYGLTASYGMSVTNSSLVTSHSVALANLAQGSYYNFQVQSIDGTNRSNSSGNQIFNTINPAIVQGLHVVSP